MITAIVAAAPQRRFRMRAAPWIETLDVVRPIGPIHFWWRSLTANVRRKGRLMPSAGTLIASALGRYGRTLHF